MESTWIFKLDYPKSQLNFSTSYVTLGKFLNLSEIQVSSFEKFK